MDDLQNTRNRAPLASLSSLAGLASKHAQQLANTTWQVLASPLPGGNGLLRLDGPHPGTVPQTEVAPRVLSPRAERAAKKESPTDIGRQGLEQTSRLLNLLAEAAHDLRAPIAIASQAIEAVSEHIQLQQVASPQDGKLLRDAQARLTQANAWLDSIMVEQRLTRLKGTNALRARSTPQQILHGLSPLLAPIAGKHHVHLKWEGWDLPAPLLYIDTQQVVRATLNLAVNSIRASRPGQVVSIQAKMSSQIPYEFEIAIVDEGPGLPPDIKRYLEAAVPEIPAQVRGLGLSIARQVTEDAGGALSVQSPLAPEIGGTRVTLKLPTDHLPSLIERWLGGYASSLARNHIDRPLRAEAFAIRALRSQNSEELDQQLQSSAEDADFVYRVSPSRWLWFSIVNEGRDTTAPNRIANAIQASQASVFKSESAQVAKVRHQRVFRSAPFQVKTAPNANNIIEIRATAERIARHAQLLTRAKVATAEPPAALTDSARGEAVACETPGDTQACVVASSNSDSEIAGSDSSTRRGLKPKQPPLVRHAANSERVTDKRGESYRRDAAMSLALRQLAKEWGVHSERLCWSVPHPRDIPQHTQPAPPIA